MVGIQTYSLFFWNWHWNKKKRGPLYLTLQYVMYGKIRSTFGEIVNFRLTTSNVHLNKQIDKQKTNKQTCKNKLGENWNFCNLPFPVITGWPFAFETFSISVSGGQSWIWSHISCCIWSFGFQWSSSRHSTVASSIHGKANILRPVGPCRSLGIAQVSDWWGTGNCL